MLTKLDKELQKQLESSGLPIITPYGLFLEIKKIYSNNQSLRLRKKFPDHDDLSLRRRNLIKANVLAEDHDYSQRAYRIVSQGNSPAEDICCLVDRFCYVSHLSAMARYGLTDRRPESLHLVTAHRDILQGLLKEEAEKDYGKETLEELSEHQIVLPRGVTHPATVRRRSIAVTSSKHLGKSIQLRGTRARISTIGQTFADMLERPNLAGGMAHVLDVWSNHADIYVEDIIECIDTRPQKLIKVRAGYILDEYLGIKDSRIEQWLGYAQRGGSQRLDPDSAYTGKFSEKWMISLNAQ